MEIEKKVKKSKGKKLAMPEEQATVNLLQELGDVELMDDKLLEHKEEVFNKDKEKESFSQLGRTIQRLRQAYHLTLSQLSDQSGVAKSIISQIERNETNPTLSTIWRLSQALNTSIENVLSKEDQRPLIEHSKATDIPILQSQDGLCTLKIIGWLNTVDWVQWYDVKLSVNGKIESEAHQRGAVENISVLKGKVEVLINQQSIGIAQAGETLRYRADFPHMIKNLSSEESHLTMVNILKRTVLEA